MTQSKEHIAVPTAEEIAHFGGDGPPAAVPQAGEGGAVEALQKELAECKDKLLRAQAECANISKRLHQQHIEDRKFAVMGLARSILSVVDNLDRTMESLADRSVDDPVVTGVRLIGEELAKVLREHGVVPMDVLGRHFDPTRHEALMQDHQSSQPAGTITQELQRGYALHDRVIRPARVAIAAGEARPAGPAAADAGQE